MRFVLKRFSFERDWIMRLTQPLFSVVGREILPLPQRPLAGFQVVSEDYFSVLRIPFAAGRPFTAQDRSGANGVCIINQSLATRLFPGESALGRVLDKIYGGSPIKLLAHLVDQHRLSDKELARMRDLLKRPKKGR